MAGFLAQYNDLYLFGGSGNVAGVFNLFDKVYCLKIDPELQKQRLLSPNRPTPAMDVNEDGFVIWGDWFEQLAHQQNIPLVEADQTPEQIFEIISKP